MTRVLMLIKSWIPSLSGAFDDKTGYSPNEYRSRFFALKGR